MKSFADTDVAFDIWNYVGYTNADIIFGKHLCSKFLHYGGSGSMKKFSHQIPDNMADYRSNILDNEDEHIIQLMER